MVYTITFNPALDYVVDVPDFQTGKTNRTSAEKILPGGKGLNVSIVLGNFGIESTALGFTAGFTGEEIERRAAEAGCRTEFIRLSTGLSRINLKLRSIEGTEINGMGPKIDPASLVALKKQLSRLSKGDVLVLAGSIPESVPDTIYEEIMRMLSEKDVLIAVDATGELLLHVLPLQPFLIKPNNHELGALFGISLRDRQAVVPYARKLQEKGARNVLVSLAGQGAVLAAEDGSIYESPAPEGKLINAVGAGDSMVAGFLTGWLETGDYAHAFRFAVAAGSASAFSEELASREEAEALLKKM